MAERQYREADFLNMSEATILRLLDAPNAIPYYQHKMARRALAEIRRRAQVATIEAEAFRQERMANAAEVASAAAETSNAIAEEANGHAKAAVDAAGQANAIAEEANRIAKEAIEASQRANLRADAADKNAEQSDRKARWANIIAALSAFAAMGSLALNVWAYVAK